MPRALVASDNFNRASLDANWEQINTGLGGSILIEASTEIKGQYTLQPTDQACAARYIGTGTFTNDQFSSAKIIIPALNNNNCTFGAIARAGAGTNGARSYYEFYTELNTGSYSLVTRLTKWVAGVRTVLASGNVTWASGDLIEIEAVGTTVRGCRNGVAVAGFSVTDTALTTGLPGVTSAGGNSIRGDDWTGGSATAPTALTWTGTIAAQSGTVGTAITPLATSGFVSGGEPPYVYSATGLPPGLTINTGTGSITGTPTTANTYNATVSATDSAATPATVNSNTFVWTIAATPATALAVTGPSSGQFGVASAAITITANGALSASKTVAGSDGAGGTVTFAGGTTLVSGGSVSATYTPSSAGAKTVTFSVSDASLSPATLAYNALTTASVIVFTGPATGVTGVASSNFTIGANGSITGSHTVTLGDLGGGGTWSPINVVLTAATPSATATYTAGTAGVKTLTASDAGGYTAPPNLSYTASSIPRILLLAAPADQFRAQASNVLLSNRAGTLWISNPTTGALVVSKAFTTDSNGLLGTIQDAALALSTVYRINFKFSAGEYGVIERISEAT